MVGITRMEARRQKIIRYKRCEVKHIGKMLILTFEDHEENMIDRIRLANV